MSEGRRPFPAAIGQEHAPEEQGDAGGIKNYFIDGVVESVVKRERFGDHHQDVFGHQQEGADEED